MQKDKIAKAAATALAREIEDFMKGRADGQAFVRCAACLLVARRIAVKQFGRERAKGFMFDALNAIDTSDPTDDVLH